MNWFCLHTELRQEDKVSRILQREFDLEVFSPRIRFRRMRAGRPLWTTEALFPVYYSLPASIILIVLKQAKMLTGVTRVVHFGDRPTPIDDAIMADLRALVQDNETVEVQNADPQPGSEVVVVGGPMRGLRALVTRVMPARQRVAILLELLGTSREVADRAGPGLSGESAGGKNRNRPRCLNKFSITPSSSYARH